MQGLKIPQSIDFNSKFANIRTPEVGDFVSQPFPCSDEQILDPLVRRDQLFSCLDLLYVCVLETKEDILIVIS